jgi:hypothetical protein
MRTSFRLLIVVTVVVFSTTVTASAAPVTPASKKVAAGKTVVATCGVVSGASVTFNTRAATVLSLTVRNLPASCNAARLWATASNAAGADLGHGGPITVASGAATVTMSPIPSTATVTQVRIVVVGP